MSQRKLEAQLHPVICRRYKAGETLTELSKAFSVSDSRIQQILKTSGIGYQDGGVYQKRRMKEESKRKEHISKYGCSKEEFEAVKGSHTDGAKSPFVAFNAQKRHANRRGVEWKLNFWEWWSIWTQSGHWLKRGRGQDSYCMCRVGDEGPYAVGNVYIGTAVHNSVLGKTLSLEKKSNITFLHRLIHCAGGPSLVASEIGVSKNYMSQAMLRNEMPKCWECNGKLEKIVSMTGGAYDIESVKRDLCGGGLNV